MELSLPGNDAAFESRVRGEIRWWEWPTVLSLDAPFVAVCWQALFARMADVQVAPSQAALLFACVWLIYAADRWIDGLRIRDQAVASVRHLYYARHRWRLFPVWLLVLATSAVAVWTALTPVERDGGFALGGLAGAYVVIHQGIHRNRLSSLPKEAIAALIFACGCALCPGSFALRRHVTGFLPAVGLFACLCFSNLVLIASWEKDIDRAQGSPSLPLQWRFAGVTARLMTGLVAAQSLILFFHDHGRAHGVFVALSLGALLLLGVDLGEPRMGRRAARVVADGVLLVPLLVHFFL